MGIEIGIGAAVGSIAIYEACRRAFVWWLRRHDKQMTNEQKIDSIFKEMHPNGGSSLKDQITLISQELSSTKATVEATQTGLAEHIQYHLENK